MRQPRLQQETWDVIFSATLATIIGGLCAFAVWALTADASWWLIGVVFVVWWLITFFARGEGGRE